MFTLRSNPIRILFWGLVCFSILMFFVAWAGIGQLFVPPTTGPGVRFVDMPAPLLALNLGLCFLPVASAFLILAGISGIVFRVPGLEERGLSWRVGRVDVTALKVGTFLAIAVVALFAGFAAAFSGTSGGPLLSILGVSLGVVFSAIFILVGWYLMFLSGWALAPLARPGERRAIFAVVVGSGGFAALLVGAGVGATLAMGSAALGPDATIPGSVSWASAASGVAGFATLLVLTVTARRVGRRYGSSGGPEAPSQPS